MKRRTKYPSSAMLSPFSPITAKHVTLNMTRHHCGLRLLCHYWHRRWLEIIYTFALKKYLKNIFPGKREAPSIFLKCDIESKIIFLFSDGCTKLLLCVMLNYSIERLVTR